MSDKYISINSPCEDLGYEVWEQDEHGERLRRVDDDLVGELNRLARLADDTANMVRREQATLIEHALLRENFTREDVVRMKVLPHPMTSFVPQYVSLDTRAWNRFVRVLKAIGNLAWQNTLTAG